MNEVPSTDEINMDICAQKEISKAGFASFQLGVLELVFGPGPS